MSLLDSPKPWKSGAPLESRVHRIRDEEEPEMSNDERRAKILNVITTSPVAVMKGFEIAKAAGLECDDEFARDMNCLKSAGSIEGLRGRGWKLAGRIVKKATLDFMLAARLEKLIVKHAGEMLSLSKLAQLTQAQLPSVELALIYLRREVKTVVMLPSGFYVPAQAPAPQEPEAVALADDLLETQKKGVALMQEVKRDVETFVHNLKEERMATAHFTINEEGTFAIQKDGEAMELNSEELQRLRAFTDKTESLWKKED